MKGNAGSSSTQMEGGGVERVRSSVVNDHRLPKNKSRHLRQSKLHNTRNLTVTSFFLTQHLGGNILVFVIPGQLLKYPSLVVAKQWLISGQLLYSVNWSRDLEDGPQETEDRQYTTLFAIYTVLPCDGIQILME